MELDHIFLYVNNRAQAERMMAKAGLRVNYSRVHPGQGTTNLCACLDDVFIELLWLDGSPVSDESKRVTLQDRGRGMGLPIGISWRGSADIATQPYAAPFLPEGNFIPIAQASLDLRLPFVFQSPGGMAPAERSDGLTGNRQVPRFTTLNTCRICLPEPEDTANLLRSFDGIEVLKAPDRAIEFSLNSPTKTGAKTIAWSF